MHSALTRLQNVFGFFTTVAACVALLIAAVGLVTTPVPPLGPGSLVLNNVQVVKGRPHYYNEKREEYAHIKFDLDVDLSTLFTWNTKQVFLYITTTYPSTNPTTPPSTAIIWDAILPHPLSPTHPNQYIAPSSSTSKIKSKTSSKSSTKAKEKNRKPKTPNAPSSQGARPGILRLHAQRPKYQITDPSGRLASRANATMELHWNVQPWVGPLTWGSPPRRSEVGRGGESAEKEVSGSWLSAWTWRTFAAGGGGRSEMFDLPALKDRKVAAKEAGDAGLGTARGGEANRGSPA